MGFLSRAHTHTRTHKLTERAYYFCHITRSHSRKFHIPLSVVCVILSNKNEYKKLTKPNEMKTTALE